MIYDQLLAKLASHKCKLTPQRKEILKVMLRAKTHLSAREIYDRLLSKHPGASFDTVYRTLAILKDLEIVNQLDFQDGRSRYELIRHQDHHHHIVCLKCGGAWEIPECPLEKLSAEMLSGSFKVVNHRFEIFGYCRECQD